MNNTLKVSKYLFNDLKKGMIIFYSIIVAIAMLMIAIYAYVTAQGGGETNFGGFGFSSLIFLFVSGLNMFKPNFKFLQANNISRKRFYSANIITLITISAFMALIDTIITRVLNLIVPYENLVEQIYINNFFFSNFMWSFALFALAASTGWFITMLYYKCNKLMKTVISLVPVLIVILLAMLNNLTEGALAIAIAKFLTAALGLNNHNLYMAVLSFFILTAGTFGLCYLLIRRMTIKD
jgi:hypothetical protein